MHNNDNTPKETPAFGLSLHVRGRKSDEVTIEDRHEAAVMCIFYVQSLFTLLSLISTDFAQRTNSTDFVVAIETFCQLVQALGEEACAHINVLESEREELTKALGEGREDE